MSAEFEAQLAAIDHATLTPLVRCVLSSETVEVIDWDRQQLHGGAGGASSIYRFSGRGHDQGEAASWSLILKAVRAPSEAEDPSSPRYWKREPLAYKSGLLDDLPGGVAAPRCFGVAEWPGEGVWLWLEDVTDEVGPRWPLEHYGVVARQFGQFNGAYLAGRPLPPYPWLSRGWVRAWVAQAPPAIALLQDSLEHPLACRWFPADSADSTLRLWAEREMFLDALDPLPQTFCHLDAFRRNLFARRGPGGHDQTVAVDWAFVGIGAVGEEIVPLVQASLCFFEVELAKAQELDEMVFEGYLDGLRDAGWHGDPRLVRLGYAAAGAMRYPLGATGGFLPMVLDESSHSRVEQVWGFPIGEIADVLAGVWLFLFGLADEARELLDILQ
jgi:hypothetical protein